MTPDQARARHAELADQIRRHDRAYDEGHPVITDYDYDLLERELLDLEWDFPELATEDSPGRRLRSEPLTQFERRDHLLPMLSLDKIQASDHPTKDEEPDGDKRKRQQDQNTLMELMRFDGTLKKQLGVSSIEYVMEPKVDGVSISIHYRHGKLALAMTRGDGKAGDDITSNVRKIRAIPLKLKLKSPPPLIEVRGEVYISLKDFEALNSRIEASGEQAFPNARNATAGTLKQLDPGLVAQRPLSAVFYAVGALEGIQFETHAQALEALKEFGLPTQPIWWVCSGMEEVLKRYQDKVVAHYDEKNDLRSKLPYEIDGIVVKVNKLADWARIPPKAKSPGYAIVHKPIPWITPAETVLKAITIQVGRTGVLTPVAELEPVFVQGSTIARATLHNEDEIRRKDIRIGDTVVIRKAGMVIPEVVEVVKAKRPKGAKEFDLFEHVGGKCPACRGPIAKEKIKSSARKESREGHEASEGEKVVLTSHPSRPSRDTDLEEEVAWRCQNIAGCPAQLMRRVEYFAQRKALDIESLGGIVAEKLVERGLVKEPLDLFDLKLEQLAKLNLGTDDEPRVFGEKNAAKILEALERAKAYPLGRWLQALGVANVGEATAFYVGKWHLDFQDVATSNLLKLISNEAQFRSKAAARNSSEGDCDETLISRRKSVWSLIRQEIDQRSRFAELLRREVENEREQVSREIHTRSFELEDLEKRVTLHKEQQKQEAALHKEGQRAKPLGQREKFHGTKLPAELKDKRASIKQRLATLDERMNKAGMPAELGPVVAESLLEYFDSAPGKRVLSRLKALEIWPRGGLAGPAPSDQAANLPLVGKSFVLTGTLPTLSRDEASNLIREAGGNVTSSVSKNTDYLLAGEDAGSKLDKARELGVKVLSEADFLQLLGVRVKGKPGAKQSELF